MISSNSSSQDLWNLRDERQKVYKSQRVNKKPKKQGLPNTADLAQYELTDIVAARTDPAQISVTKLCPSIESGSIHKSPSLKPEAISNL